MTEYEVSAKVVPRVSDRDVDRAQNSIESQLENITQKISLNIGDLLGDANLGSLERQAVNRSSAGVTDILQEQTGDLIGGLNSIETTIKALGVGVLDRVAGNVKTGFNALRDMIPSISLEDVFSSGPDTDTTRTALRFTDRPPVRPSRDSPSERGGFTPPSPAMAPSDESESNSLDDLFEAERGQLNLLDSLVAVEKFRSVTDLASLETLKEIESKVGLLDTLMDIAGLALSAYGVLATIGGGIATLVGAIVGSPLIAGGLAVAGIGTALAVVFEEELNEVVSGFSWSEFVGSLEWTDFVPGISLVEFVTGVDVSEYVEGLTDWSMFVPTITWDGFIPKLSWDVDDIISMKVDAGNLIKDKFFNPLIGGLNTVIESVNRFSKAMFNGIKKIPGAKELMKSMGWDKAPQASKVDKLSTESKKEQTTTPSTKDDTIAGPSGSVPRATPEDSDNRAGTSNRIDIKNETEVIMNGADERELERKLDERFRKQKQEILRQIGRSGVR